MIFKEQIRIFGKHAKILKKYSKDKGGDNGVEYVLEDGKTVYLFDSMIQCLMIAMMYGIINNRKGEVSHTGDDFYATIFLDVINKNRKNLERIYQHYVLSDKSIKEKDSRIKKAFSTDFSKEEDKRIEDEMMAYALGGLEIIDENYCECKSLESIIVKLPKVIE